MKVTLSDGKRHSLPFGSSWSWCVTVYHLVNVAPSAVAAAAADIASAAADDDDDGAAAVAASSSERQEMRTR